MSRSRRGGGGGAAAAGGTARGPVAGIGHRGGEEGKESTGWLDGDGKSWEGDERWVEVWKRFGYFLFCPLSFFNNYRIDEYMTLCRILVPETSIFSHYSPRNSSIFLYSSPYNFCFLTF